MNRLFSLTVLTAITVAALGSQGWAQFNGSKSTPTRSSNTSGSSTYPPGPVWILASEGIQQEVGLSAQQRRGVQDLFAKLRTSIQQNMQRVQELPRDQQAEEMTAVREKTNEQLETTRTHIEALLSPEQLARLEKIDFNMRALSMLMNSNTVEQLRLSPEQKEKLRGVYEELQQKVQVVQREISDKVVDVLTPEQRQRLKRSIPQARSGGQ